MGRKQVCAFCLGLLAAGCSSGVLRPLPGAPSEPPPPSGLRGEGATAPASAEPLWVDASVTVGWFPVTHRFPAEQRVNTPVPIYFEPPEGTRVRAATLQYKAFGATNYKKASMRRMGAGFAYEVPCTEVATTGHLKYFIELVGSDGEPLDSIGSKIAPLRVRIKVDLEGGPPSLPGQEPPRQCPSSCDGFPPGAPDDPR